MSILGRRALLKAGAAAAGLAQVREMLAATVQQSPPPTSGDDWSSFRGLYSLSPEVVYLNHASIGTIPRPLADARSRYQEICEGNPWLYMWGGAWEEAREDTRRRAAQLLGCQPRECAITHNTTEGFNLLAAGLPLQAGDEVLFSSLNHPGASICWHHQARLRGFTVRQFQFPLERVPELTADELLAIYGGHISERTRVLVFPHIDNIVGIRYPLARLARLAHDRGVRYVAVDGAQSVGMIDIELDSSGVDFYAASPHKWLQAPKGLGLLYVRAAHLGALEPIWVTWGQQRWSGTARIYEDYGTRNLAEALTLGNAIAFHTRIPADARHSRQRLLWQHLKSAVEDSPHLVWHSPLQWEMASALCSVEMRGRESRDVFEQMSSRWGFMFRPFQMEGFNSNRISPNLLNTRAELDRFVELSRLV